MTRGRATACFVHGVVAWVAISGCAGAPSIQDTPLGPSRRVLAAAGHHVVATEIDGQTIALEVASDGSVLSRTAFPPESFATLAVAHGTLLDRVAGRVRARRPGAQRSRWSWPQTGRATGLAVQDRVVAILDDLPRACVLDLDSGAARDCAALASAGMRVLALAQFADVTWLWLRSGGGVSALRMDGRCADAGCEGRDGAIVWSAALAGDRPDPVLVGDALWLEPAAGVVELRDGRTGALRLSELRPRLGDVFAATGAIVLLGRRDDGVAMTAAIEGRNLALRWAVADALGTSARQVVGEPGVVRLRGEGTHLLLRAADGRRLGRFRVGGAGESPDDRAAANEEAFVDASGAVARVHALAAGAERALPALPSRPRWLMPGTALHYLLVRPDRPPLRLSWTLEHASASGLRLQVGVAGEQGVQVWDEAVLAANRQICAVAPPAAPRSVQCPLLILGRDPLSELGRGREVRIGWPGQAPEPALDDGPGLHAATFRGTASEAPTLLHIASRRIVGRRGGGRMEVATYAGLPLLLTAERAGEMLVLVGVSLPTATVEAALVAPP